MSSGGGHGGGLPGLHVIEHWLHGAHNEGGTTVSLNALCIAFAAEIVAFFLVAPAQTVTNFQFVVFAAPVWIPILLYHFGYMRFIFANRVIWAAKQKTVLLEIKLPRDTRRGPLAMETVFSSMHIGGGESTWYKRIIEGRSRPWYSYELVSIGGQVHFYVWLREAWRRTFESFMYAQYPGVEIIEAMDYSRLVDPSHHGWSMTAFEFSKTNPDPYPIKTYVDFGLDKVQKPEEQIDPLAQVLEVMGSLGPKEQMWLQFVIRTHGPEKYSRKNDKGKDYSWKDAGYEETKRIREEYTIQNEYIDANGVKQTTTGFPNPTEGQKDRLKAIEANIGKPAYDVGIRGMYLAPEDAAVGVMGGLLVNIFKPYSSAQYNSLMPNGRWSDHFKDYPWEDKSGHHLHSANHAVVQMYRRRAFFHPPYNGAYNVMSVEELATMYHIPSSSVTTPSLPRIQSTTSEAPTNLPT